MKFSIHIGLTLFPIVIFLNSSMGQRCRCDSIIESRRSNWQKLAQNSDSIRIVQVKNIGVIKTKESKDKLLRLLNSDSAWVAFPESGQIVHVRLGRWDTLAGKHFLLSEHAEHFDTTLGKTPGSTAEPQRHVMFLTKSERYKAFDENIFIGDEYYEVYIAIGKKIIMSPTICSPKYCTILDNVIYNLTFAN